MTVVVLPPMSAAQEQAWAALLDIAERLPSGWCLVGGQMVHLHCVERGVVPQRPTDDADAALNVRSRPAILAMFTGVLVDLGFTSAGESLEGHQHRWVRDAAQIDVLIPRHVGARAAVRRGVTGGTTLESPGTQQALDRTETVTVRLGERVGPVLRPDLLGGAGRQGCRAHGHAGPAPAAAPARLRRPVRADPPGRPGRGQGHPARPAVSGPDAGGTGR